MRIKKLDERVELLREFITYAKKHAILFQPKFNTLYDNDVPEEDLVEFTRLCQQEIELRVYSVPYAAAWLGLSKRGVVEAYRTKRLPFIRPGREVLFLHEDLVKFAQERRYEL
jgi:excisionase family DNA binding protein